MAVTPRMTRVLAICDPGSTREQITTALTTQTEFQLVNILDSLEKLSREINFAEPDLILIDHQVGGQVTLDVIDDIVMQFSEVPIVAILPESDPIRAQQVTLAGARTFITVPFTQVTLLSTLRRVHDLEARRASTQARAPTQALEAQPMRTIAVYSPRGGVGCSTVATNLAIALHEASGARVLLIDGKLQFGHLDLLLNLRSRNTLADLIPHASALDAGLVGDVVVEHASGIFVLLSPGDFQVAQGVRSEDLYNIMIGIKRHFEYVVIDAGSALTENTVTLLDTADRILLLVTPDLATLHDASRFFQICRTLGYHPTKLSVVLNREGMPGGLRTRDIESALHQELFAQIGEDEANTLRSFNRGIPLLMKYPRSQASRSIHRLANILLDLSVVEGQEAQATSQRAKSKKWSSKSQPARVSVKQRAKT